MRKVKKKKNPHPLLFIFVGKLVGMGKFLNNYTHLILSYYLVNIISIYKIILSILFIVHSCFIFLCFYVYMSLFIFMFILLLFVCVIMLVSLRWVLDHLLGFVWEVPLGGNSPIPPRHLGIFTILAFNLCHPFYFPSKPRSPFNLCHPFYFPSNPFPFLIYVIHFIHICIYVCLCVCVCV